MGARKRHSGWTAHPETVWGETLDVAVARANKAAARLRKVGIGAVVQLTKRATKFGVTVSRTARGRGVIAGWGNHKWTVRVRPNGQKTARAFHARFWEPVDVQKDRTR